MTIRHVHFSPSAASSSSWGTPLGLMSPQQPGCPPVKYAPLPPMPCSPHTLLSVTASPLLYYHLTMDPSAAQLHPSLPRQALTEPATQPPLPFISIISPHLPWSINVTPSKLTPYVTVADVLDALYNFLRQNVTPEDFKSLNPRDQQRATDAYKRRYKRIPDPRAYEQEKAKGVKRVDFLFEKVVFMGLVGTKYGPEMWELHVAAPA